MKIQNHKVSGKDLVVIDNAFSRSQMDKFYKFLYNSYYEVGGGGHVAIEDAPDLALQSMYSKKDLDNFGLFNDMPEEVKKLISGLEITRAYSLLMNYAQKPHYHSDTFDSRDKTLLYYPNIKWDVDWGGETVFANDDLDDIEYTSIYRPGRMVLFDSRILHKPCTPSLAFNGFRFTFVANLSPQAN